VTDTETPTPVETPAVAAESPVSVAHQFALLVERIADASRRPLLISQTDAPEFLGMSRSMFFRLKAEGYFRPVSLPGNPMYRRKDLEQWVEKLKFARG
jgi:predicted DNA-binding transcriptional regulator AlpA